MGKNRKSLRSAVRNALKSFANVAAGRVATVLLALSHRCDRVWISNVGGAIMRTIGPWLPEHRIGRANLRAARKVRRRDRNHPAGRVDNLGRVGAEIASSRSHLLRRSLQPQLHRLRSTTSSGSCVK
jgi:KDO2-lipid IV(A) lauroyltransferase